MKITSFLLAVLCSLAIIPPLPAAETARPNILYFYVDDLGWGSIGPNGQAARKAAGKPYVRTPNIDRLARQGVNFTRGYGCFVCSPARSSQQTGFHQGHTYADRNDPNNARKAMRRDDMTMGDALAAAGYVTGYWGKWGFGGSKDMQNPQIDNVQTLPTSHGYQHVLAELHHVRAHTFFQPTLWRAPAPTSTLGGIELVPNSLAAYQGCSDCPTMPALQNHPDYPQTAYCDDAYAFAALDFVRTQAANYRETGQPFFGLLGVQIPHAPFDEIATLPEWDRAYADDPHFDSLADQSRQWAAMVTRIDAHFGNILAALEDPNNDGDTSDSIADNTLVVFQSDNGGPKGKSYTELDSNGGLRDAKGSIYEGGIRVPLVMRWPAEIDSQSRLQAGSNSDMIVDVTDLLPTFCELAGVDPPLGIDGVSVAPTLRSKGHQRHRDFLIHESSRHQSIIRGDDKLIRSNKNDLELYNLHDDHTESNNIADKHPALVKELEAILLAERVDEPKGFANTYHQWKGNDGDRTSATDHWTEYRYANAGITYLVDDGAPQAAWIAQVVNRRSDPSNAVVDKDLHLLGLAVAGNAEQGGTQSLLVADGLTVTGRNEVRIGAAGQIKLDSGTVASLRWVDVKKQGTLSGSGLVDASLYNHGLVSVEGKSDPQLRVDGNYHQLPSGTLRLRVTATKPALQISGTATVAGELQIDIQTGSTAEKLESIPILIAERVAGTFSSPSNTVVADDGTRFKIEYSETTVMLSPLR